MRCTVFNARHDIARSAHGDACGTRRTASGSLRGRDGTSGVRNVIQVGKAECLNDYSLANRAEYGDTRHHTLSRY